MSTLFEIADRHVAETAALDPIAATHLGIPGFDDQLTDYSPAGVEARANLARQTCGELDRLEGVDAESVGAAVMRERLETELAWHDLDEHLRPLAVIGSPVSNIRSVFDLMATETASDWEQIAQRMNSVPDALDSLRASLEAGRDAGTVAARRQALACAKQAATWGEPDSDTAFFAGLAEQGAETAADPEALQRAAEHASEAYAALATYLRDDYARDANEHDAVGAERYAILARGYNGCNLDLRETYQWGWDELARLNDQMARVAPRIVSGAGIAEAVAYHEGPDGPAVEGTDQLQIWLQELIDTTIEAMDGTHFDIAEPVRICEAMIAPPGGAAAQYYTPPSEDFSRPGRTWYPPQGKTRFPLWREVSTCYHEGVPGHHLQVGQVTYLADRLDRFQRTLAWTSGHGEGWALYAERLMEELGYLDDPAYELGMLSAQALRAARIVVDIGLHLELPIPEDDPDHGGETWRPELALPFLVERSLVEAEFLRSEVDRYLGLAGQAISYKVGERVWLECRADARRRHGADFDLKAFHTYALDLGNMGLDLLADRLALF